MAVTIPLPDHAASCPSPSHPEFLGLARLMRLNFAGVELTSLCQSLLARAEADPDDAYALLDASVLLQFYRQPELALQVQAEALKLRRHYRQPTTRPLRLRLLALMAPGNLMANVPVECLLEDSDIELTISYATADPAAIELPEHDVLFFAMSETEDNRPLIEAWAARLAAWPKPVINDPAHIHRVARDTVSRLLQDHPGLAVPPTFRLTRENLDAIVAGWEGPAGTAFPLILRPLDSHAGNDLYKVDNRAELAQKLAAMAGDEFFIAPFVDYRSADGLFRKYRVVLVAGRPFACHMGISDHWMIHYLNAGMADSAAKRAEEAAFMEHFDQDFALRHQAALDAVYRAIGLDYLGIDCAETTDGRLLIFEAEHAMVVHAMDPVDRFAYKQAPMQKLFAAFRAMVLRAAGCQDAAA
ncbi:hypothetical protein DLREEDagrD3_15270 [Denitratisoma sp. agr-D3]